MKSMKSWNKLCLKCSASLACVAGVTDYFRNYSPDVPAVKQDNVLVTVFKLIPIGTEITTQFTVPKSCPGYQKKTTDPRWDPR